MDPDRRPRVGVYCASRLGDDPAFTAAAERTGRELSRRGIDVVFGGGEVGLMGIVADAALSGGSHVIGVVPDQLAGREMAHSGLSELRRVPDMPARKQIMFTEADAFMTLPGGIGTLEELFEVLSWAVLGIHPKPVGLLNVSGYYDHLLAFLESSVRCGLSTSRVRTLLLDDHDPSRLLDRLFPSGDEHGV